MINNLLIRIKENIIALYLSKKHIKTLVAIEVPFLCIFMDDYFA